MKLSDFWTDLPSALCDISKEILTQEEISVCHLIVNSSKVNISLLNNLYNKKGKILNLFFLKIFLFPKQFTTIYETFMKSYENIDIELQADQKELITRKLDSILKQKAEIVCRAIKFCVKLMSKFSKHLMEEKEKSLKPPCETLLQTKIFLKITRLIIDNSKISVENSHDKQKEFFKM